MVKLGEHLPDITLKNQNGENVRLHDFEATPLVIYFYPKDETPGCTKEACEFRDDYSEFEALGAKVFGISADSVKSHQRFAAKHRLNFQLLSDPNRIAEKAFDVPRSLFGLLPGRVTFVFDSDRKLIYKFDSALRVDRHAKEALRALKKTVAR